MSRKTDVIVIYAEPQLQKTLSFSTDLTVRQAIQKGQKGLETHLSGIKGFPDIVIDQECTDFYPVANLDTKLSDLQGLKTIVCWPKGREDAENLTPSPLIDSVLKAQKTVNHLDKPLSTSAASDYGTPTKADSTSLLSRIATLESYHNIQDELRKGVHARLTNLEQELVTAKTLITTMEKQHRDLQTKVAAAQDALTLTMSAILGDQDSLTQIRLQILCDRARAQLAKACGFDDWIQFEAETVDSNDMFNTASRAIRRDTTLSQHWKILGSTPSCLWLLISPQPSAPSTVEAAPGSVESNAIGQSLWALEDESKRDLMKKIYRAVYESEPEQTGSRRATTAHAL